MADWQHRARFPLSFLAGACFVHSLPAVPPALCSLFVSAAALALLFACARGTGRARRALRLVATSIIGAGWAAAVSDSHVRPLPAEALAAPVTAHGCIVSVPTIDGGGARFDFALSELDGRAQAARVRLRWYHPVPTLAAGDCWQLRARLFAPWGYANPGGLDYQRWLFRRGIAATGYVRSEPSTRLTRAAPGAWLLTRREQLASRIETLAGEGAAGGPLIGLAVGLRDRMTDAQWQVLRRTGTTHLFAISGLHVGLVAGLVLGGAGRLWPCRGPLARIATPFAASRVAALLGAAAYAALAGFALPTRRALLMLALLIGAQLMRRQSHGLTTLGRVLVIVLLLDPLAPLDAGFWLSFLAVAVLLAAPPAGGPGLLRGTMRVAGVQLRLSLLLLPATVLFFGELSLVAPIANLFAIPVFALAIVPAVLLGAICLALPAETPAAMLFAVAALLLDGVFHALSWLAERPLASLSLRRSVLPLAVAQGAVVLVLCRGAMRRLIGSVALVAALAWPASRPPPGQAQIAVLDVGQGLAVVVRTHRHALLYDAGPAFRGGGDTGAQVVLPYLQALGVRRLDRIVVSHADLDHRGGIASVRARYPSTPVFAGEPRGDERTCAGLGEWHWDDVTFRMLHPAPGARFDGNDASCVLRIEAGGQRLLLTGDVELAGELMLLRTREWLPAQVVVAPHHGSSTSSSASFVEAVGATHVIYPAARGNRFGFPHPAVTARWAANGARSHTTGRAGAVTVTLGAPAGPTLSEYRASRRRHWHTAGHPPPLAEATD